MAVARTPVVLLRRLAASPPATTCQSDAPWSLVPVHRYLRLNQYEPRGYDKCTDDYTGPLFIPGCCARSNLDSCAVVDVANVIALLVIVPVRVAFLLLAPTPILLKVV